MTTGITCNGVNSHTVAIGDIRMVFSYRTLIAVRRLPDPWVVSRNEWGTTTGKHLNEIDGGGHEAHTRRLPHPEVLRFAETLGAEVPSMEVQTR